MLVRESVRAFVSRSDDVDALDEAKSTRTIAEGETLILVGEAAGKGGARNRRVDSLRQLPTKAG